MKTLICLLLLTALALTAGDITGKWKGTLDVTTSGGDTRSDPVYMDLKVDGAQVTGTLAINPDHPFTIRHGKLQAGKLTFDVLMADPVVFDLVSDGNTIRGGAKGSTKGGAKTSAKVEFKRAS